MLLSQQPVLFFFLIDEERKKTLNVKLYSSVPSSKFSFQKFRATIQTDEDK